MNEDIYDSSKLKDYLVCPRYFFFRHILGWQAIAEKTNLHLIFGEAWHRLKECLLIGNMSSESVDEGIEAFKEYYNQFFSEGLADELNYPKSTGGAIEAAVQYVKRYQGSNRFKVKYLDGTPMTEIFGRVPINIEKNREVCFRIDAICTYLPYNQICFIDHKTSSSDRESWKEYWQLSLQMALYTHVLYFLEKDGSKVYGGIVDGTIFRKKGMEQVRVLIKKTVKDMNIWLWEINNLVDNIELDISRMLEIKEKDVVMKAFSRNPESCSKYGRMCPYHDLCVSWSNPIQYKENPPAGFEVDFWNPDRERDHARFILDKSGKLCKKEVVVK